MANFTPCAENGSWRHTLVLMLTYDCNLSCWFCPVRKSRRKMELAVARRATELFVQEGLGRRIRFFGGEPLLEFDTIRNLVETWEPDPEAAGIRFEVTTNGSLLNPEIVRFVERHPCIDLTVSVDEEKEFRAKTLKALPRLPNVTCNLTLSPDGLGRVFPLFVLLCEMGFNRFNILPACYVRWSRGDLARLDSDLSALAALSRSRGLVIKNVEASNTLPLFLDALSVDVDGEVYSSTAFFASRLSPHRRRFGMGNVRKSGSLGAMVPTPCAELERVVWSNVSQPIAACTRAVDRLLCGFVEKARASHVS